MKPPFVPEPTSGAAYNEGLENLRRAVADFDDRHDELVRELSAKATHAVDALMARLPDGSHAVSATDPKITLPAGHQIVFEFGNIALVHDDHHYPIDHESAEAQHIRDLMGPAAVAQAVAIIPCFTEYQHVLYEMHYRCVTLDDIDAFNPWGR